MTHRCGTVSLVGRPNTGKSSLLNRLVGEKLSIVSARPQTTRHLIRGIVSLPACQTIFLDGGYPAARRAVLQAFGAQLAQIDPGAVEKDAKTSLQELLHARGKQPPEYHVVATHGAPHERSFDVECIIEGMRTTGQGTSRQRAEQEAARAMLDQLQ